MSFAQHIGARVRQSAADLGITIALWLLTLWGVGAQSWTGMNTPDSQFSASLAIFGNQVNERALDPSYYWTRLGYLGPVHLLTGVFGIWNGFALWRAFLLLVIIVTVYWMARQFTDRAIAAMLAMFVVLNTMVLAYVGNPYATGTAMAASLLLFACAIAHFSTAAKPSVRRLMLIGSATGGVLAWLIMLNPYNALLAGATWLGIRVIGVGIARPALRALITEVLAIAGGFVVIFLGFLLWGQWLFPGFNWLQTYRSWNARLDYASFISDPHIWLHDTAALVVLLAFVMSVIALAFAPNRWSASAMMVSSITIVFTLAYMQVIPGPWIEAPHYAAMCWPGALLAIALAIGAIVQGRRRSDLLWLGLPVLIVAMVWAGHWSAQLSMPQGLLLVLLCAVLMVLSTVSRQWRRALLSWSLVMLTIVALGVSAQWLQNGRGNLGIYSQYPMNAAFVDYQAEPLMRSDVTAEEFVLANTSPDDRVATWTDPTRLTATVAAMQLWGAYNNAPGLEALDNAGQRALRDLRPTVIAMYAPTREEIDHYFASIPAWFMPTAMQCTSVPYLGIGSPDAHVCLTHIQVQ